MHIQVGVWSHWRRESWEGLVEIEDGLMPDAVNRQLWRTFNRVYDGDEERLEALGYRLPSLSVDDIIMWGGKGYVVRPIGFEEIAL